MGCGRPCEPAAQSVRDAPHCRIYTACMQRALELILFLLQRFRGRALLRRSLRSRGRAGYLH